MKLGDFKPRSVCSRKIAVATLLLVHLAACNELHDSRPSFILINVDTLRADYLGCYGFRGDISPHIDRLASDSFLFDQSFVQAPWTKPSVASLLTSLYPQVLWGNTIHQMKNGVIPDEVVTLPEALQADGYETAAFIGNPWLAATFGFSQGFDFYDDHVLRLDLPADQLTSNAQAWIETRSGQAPFLLFLQLMDVHDPYNAPKADFDAFAAHDWGEERMLTDQEVAYNRVKHLERKPEWATQEMRHKLSYWKARYASQVRVMDRRLGRFLDFLHERGFLERAYLVLTSDHGEELFEHGGWSHTRHLFDHQLSVPLIIRPPGGLPEARRVEDIVESVDLMPTMLALAGAPAEPMTQGRDISGLFMGRTIPEKTAAFATASRSLPELYSIRTHNHKLLFDIGTGETRLYDLATDPGEQRNLASAEPETVERLKRRLLHHIAESTSQKTLEAESVPIPEDVVQKLRSIGYVN